MTNQRQRPRRRHHLVSGIDIVFHQHRYPMHRAPNVTGLPLFIQLIGNRQRIRIDLDDRMETRSGLVDLFDPLQIKFRNGTRRIDALLHLLLQHIDRGLIQCKFGRRRTAPPTRPCRYLSTRPMNHNPPRPALPGTIPVSEEFRRNFLLFISISGFGIFSSHFFTNSLLISSYR